MSSDQRCEIAAQMSGMTREIALENIRARHPDYDDHTSRMRYFACFSETTCSVARGRASLFWPHERERAGPPTTSDRRTSANHGRGRAAVNVVNELVQ